MKEGFYESSEAAFSNTFGRENFKSIVKTRYIWAPLPAEILGTVMAVYLWRMDRKAAVKLKDARTSY